jgi:pimeloyl-ACP methyl ester carboxylesterase
VELNYLLLPSLVVLAGLACAWLSGRRLLTLWSKPFGAARKAVETIVLSLVAVIALVLAVSSAVNASLFVSFRSAPPGVRYRIDGYLMRIDCTGSGAPTLVLESGLANGGLVWAGVQPALARVTRVCSYDRAGNGWSDPVPSPRDADHVADELHKLLEAAHVGGPVVLMGHSLGGIYIRDYAARYRSEVAGLIFVDSSIPLEDRKGVTTNFPPRSLVQAALSSGVAHWAILTQYPKAPALAVDDACYPNLQGASDEMAQFERSGDEALRAASYGNLPILIVSHDPDRHPPGSDPGELRSMRIFDRLQQEQLGLSRRSRRIVARGSGHVVQFDRPELIETSVASFIGEIRGTTPPARYGVTTTE